MKDSELIESMERGDLGDNLHVHFESICEWDWTDVFWESRRLASLLMFDGDEVEDDSPLDDLLAATAAAASSAAYAHIAASLGVDGKALELAVAHWCEEKGRKRYYRPVQPEALLRKAHEYEEWLADLEAGEDLNTPASYTKSERADARK